MLEGAGIPSISEESGVDTECGSGSPSSEGPGCIGTEGAKRSVGSLHGAMPSGYSCLPTFWVAYVGIMRVRPNELYLIDQRLCLAGGHIALEVYSPRDGQPRGNRASRRGTTGETEEALMRSLIGSSTKKRS